MKTLLAVLAALTVTGCAAPKARDPALEAAAREPLTCAGAEQCSRYWRRAQVWVATHSTWKIQTATDVLIQTYNPVNASVDAGYTVIREPLSGAQERIMIRPLCANMFSCVPDPFQAAADFKTYVRQ